jgi:diguanylate cyclase (GGDEF)-like protein
MMVGVGNIHSTHAMGLCGDFKNKNIMVSWKAYLTLGALATLLIPFSAQFGMRDTLYFTIVFYSLLCAGWGVNHYQPKVRSPWIYYVVAIASQCLGALIQANSDASGAFGTHISIADGFLLLGHLCMVVALWQFASKRHREFPKYGCFQGWILATSLILIGWQFLFLPTIVRYGFSIDRPQIFRMVYPTLSYVEIGMLLWVWISSHANQSKAFILLVMATFFFAAGESLFHGTSHSLAVPNDLNLMLWLFAYVMYGAVALHPEMKQLAVPKRSEESSHVSNVLSLLLPLVLLLPVTLLIIYFKALHPATIGILVGFFLIIVVGWYQLSTSMQNIIHVKRQLEQQNRTDYLTGIPNRNHMEHVVGASLYQAGKRHYGENGLLLIDIDGFKSINNIFGFGIGDAILKHIARHLYAESVRREHHFARVDGDEFTLLMLNVDNRCAIEAQAWQIHRLLDDPINIDGVTVKVTCSIGVSIHYALKQANFATMLKESERALVWAKENQSQVEIYDKRKDIVEDKSWVLTEFRHAIAAHQLEVFYQPKIQVGSQTVMGVEALIRWHHPERGLVMPCVFMQQIEATDLIHHLFTLVLNDTTKQWPAWQAQGLCISIALNVTARDLINFDLVHEIKTALEQNHMPANYLEIEITESSALSDPARVKHVLSGLMALGIKISIDDYGTGYSSLLYLQQLPLHCLKIDQQFVREMRHDQASAAIVRSTLELAKNLNIEVIAEGVDDVWVYQQLKALGCYGVQGFLFSQAVAAAKVLEVVQAIEAAEV